MLTEVVSGAPNGIRTRAAALKGRCPRPLDDGGRAAFAALTLGARRRGPPQHRGRTTLPAKRLATAPYFGRSEHRTRGHRRTSERSRAGRSDPLDRPPGRAAAAASAKTITTEPLAQLLIFRHGRHSTNDVGSLLPVTGHVWPSRDQLQRVRYQLHCARRHRKADKA